MDNTNGEKKRYQGNWKCGKCGKDITSLPFEPDPARLGQLTCFDCHKKKQESMGR